MVFLVRDAPDDYGFESGGQTVDMLLKNGLVDNAHEGAEIASCFDAVRGFNMPYPGEEIARGFRGTEVTYRALFEGCALLARITTFGAVFRNEPQFQGAH